jgi:signal transduction histidine kinase/ligand-binding sensor domain-containing protein
MSAFARFLQIAIGLTALGIAGRGLALDPARSLSQLHHTAWTIADGAPPDVWSLAQSLDGYLLLGTGAGLFRFDGVRFEKVRIDHGGRLLSTNMTAILADRGGSIWIGDVSGNVSRLHAGQLKTFNLGMPNTTVYQLAEDAEGAVWAAMRSERHGGLMRYANGRWQLIGPDWGLPIGGATGVISARDGRLWVIANGALFVLGKGSRRFAGTGQRLRATSGVVEAPNGQIWISSDDNGEPHPVSAVMGGAASNGPRLKPPKAFETDTARMIIDRDGSLWGSYQVGGVYRITGAGQSSLEHGSRQLRAEKFANVDGLTSDIARPILEDREGNIWVGTNLGIDRFRAANVVAAPGITPTSRHGYLIASGDRSAVYVATGDKLYRSYPDRPAILLRRLPSPPDALFAAAKTPLWLGLDGLLERIDDKRPMTLALPKPATGRIIGLMSPDDGTLCASVERTGVFCRRANSWEQFPLYVDATESAPSQMEQDSKHRVWLNYGTKLAVVEAGHRRVFGPADGLTIGRVGIISTGPGEILVGGDFGLARYDGSRFATLSSERFPVLSRIAGIVQARAGDIWINSIRGVVRINRAELASAFAHPEGPLSYSLFDLKDGLPGVAQQDSGAHTAIEASDGRLWFVTSHGIAWIDPSHLTFNQVAPPVSIQSLTVNGKEFPLAAPIKLPEGTANLQIDYTALSLSIPERVRFRYRLEGVDSDWVDPGTRRQAFYTKLLPGTYQFQVIAANNDGVWNTSGAKLTLTIPPTFLQSYWFKALIALIIVAVIWIIYSIRLRQLAGDMRRLLEERIGERERIARELHDTLLQGFQGLVFRFQAIAQDAATNPVVRDRMERALDQADGVLVEGRNRVRDLRVDKGDPDLSQLFIDEAARLLPESGIAFRVFVEGKPRRLHPLVREEVARIGCEALANAVNHAQPDCVEISIGFHANDFRIHIRDNGVGIDPKILAGGGRSNHFGLIGMRERADKIRGDFTVSSQPHAGTAITLVIPGSIAYLQPIERARRRRIFRGLGEVIP